MKDLDTVGFVLGILCIASGILCTAACAADLIQTLTGIDTTRSLVGVGIGVNTFLIGYHMYCQ